MAAATAVEPDRAPGTRAGETIFPIPTERGNMTKVDSKGRIVLPKEVRDELDIESGTEVEVRTDDGKAVVEPERDPAAIIDRMEQLVESAAAEGQTATDDRDVYARDHAETIRRQAREAQRDDE